MSVESHGYVGPFVVCKNHYVDAEKMIRACANEQCTRFQNAIYRNDVHFCECCGSQLTIIPITKRITTVDVVELCEDLEERFCTVGNEPFVSGQAGAVVHEPSGQIDVWINNKTNQEIGKSFFPNQEFISIPIKGDIKKDIEKFEKQFADVFRKSYGPENVQIELGVLNWLR
jgi:hypothetical protein